MADCCVCGDSCPINNGPDVCDECFELFDRDLLDRVDAHRETTDRHGLLIKDLARRIVVLEQRARDDDTRLEANERG